ncbi:hypothetical protein Ait01nite_040810 [Actinoplanes italicus]|uniref:Uncharacterized protein n=1 Tax=Actinoplanes italicus TaxID=113567 RepID=A0A2T0K205_9ACTN|nr:hypothetical protein [Actinoplanes italicus]PRX16832.1 hypothetical protein CLV67_118163 [Actinoplanes italicus]GIE31036.1 hypothetical protein Ait01nite_040810 [Actinoplanes italicus]
MRFFRRGLTVGCVVAFLGGCLWSVGFAWLWLTGDEGALPPTWRMPDLPAGAEIVDDEDMACGSGGCTRLVKVRPPDGQSPEDLAGAMGVDRSQVLSPALFDPAEVYLAAEPDGSYLIVHLQYRGGLK